MNPNEILGIILAGEGIDSEQATRLQTALSDDPDFRRTAWEQLRVHRALLAARLQHPLELARKVDALVQAQRRSGVLRMVSTVNQRLSQRQRWRLSAGLGAAAAAIVLLVSGLLWHTNRQHLHLELQNGSYVSQDGTRIELAPGCRARVLPAGSVAQLELSAGRLEATIAKQPPGGTFIIATPQGSATVLGTRFLLQTGQSGTWLGVQEGQVRLSGPGGSLKAGPGQTAMLTSDGKVQELPGWKNRRPLAALILNRTAMPPGNPNGWFDDPDLDVRGPDGRQAFANRMLAETERICNNLASIHAQGVILWDLEGGAGRVPKYPGDPRLVVELAPEMDAVADRVFARFRQAGLATGVRIGNHPWRLHEDGSRSLLPDDGRMLDEMTARMTYAQQRWGCTLFFLGWNLNAAGLEAERQGPVNPALHATPASLLVELRLRFPDSLIIAEFVPEAGWATTAGFLDPTLADLARLHAVQSTWPQAGAVVKIRRDGLSREVLDSIRADGAIPLLFGTGDYPSILEDNP